MSASRSRWRVLGYCLLAMACVVLVAAGPAGAAAPTFTRTDVSVGGGPTSVASVDVNHDSHLDLVVANGFDDTVSFLAGDGDGGFSAPVTSMSGGDGPFGIAAADFSGDGEIDVAVTNRYSNRVTILTGNGKGAFSLLRSITVGKHPIGIEAADMNEDGRLDLVVAHVESAYLGGVLSAFVSVLTGNGAGAFTRQDTLLPTNGQTNLATGDFNEDGHLDVALTHHRNSYATVLFGDGAGHLALQPTIPTSSTPLGVACADLNRDGHLELCVAGSTLSVFRGNGSGRYASPTVYAVGRYAKVIEAADLNLDGILDLTTSNYYDNTLSVLTGVGDGTLAPRATHSVGTNPHYVIAADLDEDGRLDLAVPNEGSATVSILRNTTPFTQLDVTPPVTTSSADGAWHRTAVTVTLTAIDNLSGVAATYYRIDAGDWHRGTSVPVSGDGVHSVQFYSVDNAGNTEATRSAQVKIDATAPLTTSTADAAWHNTAVTVSLNPSDATSGLATTSYRLDGGAWKTGTSLLVSGDGVHGIDFYSADNAGNTEAVKSAQVKIDATAPTGTVTTPTDGASYVQGSAATCDWTATDPGAAASGLAGEEATVDGQPIAKGDRLDTLALGGHDFSLTVTDAAGNSSSAAAHFTVTTGSAPDTTPPTTTAVFTGTTNGSGWWTGASLTIDLTADDGGDSGVGATWFALRSEGQPEPLWPAGYTQGTSLTLTTSGGVNDGTHTLYYRSVDLADPANLEPVRTTQVPIDATAPVATVIAPTAGATYAQYTIVQCDWSAGDGDGSGVGTQVATVDGMTVAKGARMDTFAAGAHTFALSVADNAGNVTTVTVPFAVVVPQLALTWPLGGESVVQGSTQTVAWTMANPVAVGRFRVWLRNAAGTFVQITPAAVQAVPGQIVYSWTWSVTQAPITNSVLRLRYYNEAGTTIATVERPISVLSAQPTFTWPLGGESVVQGSTQTVAWTMANPVAVGRFRVWLRNAAGTFVQITPAAIQSVPGQIVYSWTWSVTQSPITNSVLRLRYYNEAGTTIATVEKPISVLAP